VKIEVFYTNDWLSLSIIHNQQLVHVSTLAKET